MAEVNRSLLSILPTEEILIFATAIYLVIDLANNQIRFANAGHPDPILQSANEASTRMIRHGEDPIGPALGLLAESEFPTQSAKIQHGDKLLLYTDGIYEVYNQQGVELSKECLLAIIKKDRPRDAQELVDVLLEAARQHSHDQQFKDDVCLLAIEYLGAAAPTFNAKPSAPKSLA